jgi:phage shock protein E
MDNIEKIIKKGAIIIDVRTPEEYREVHINGSINIPLSDIENATSWLIKDVPVILCCASGSRSNVAKKILDASGFLEVYNGGNCDDLGKFKKNAGCPIE